MSRDKASLLDIANAVRRVLKFAEGLDKSALAIEKQSAFFYQVIIMGEAVKRLSAEFRNQHPEVPWRDILTHHYDRVNLDTLWDVIQNDIPELLALLEPLLPHPDKM
jgi:uncharacterized protein with HEPN domain